MKKIFIASLVLLLTAFGNQNVLAQRKVLFETFTGPASPTCIPQTETAYEDAAFLSSSSTATEKASKIVHLNYYLGSLPPSNLDIGGGPVDARLSGTGAIYTSAVDRTTFSATGEKVDPTTSGSYSDWGPQIDNDAAASPEATVTLNFATLDKTNTQSYKLHADLTVTANQDISDSLIIRYAITQDKVSFTECGGAKVTFNDMVWKVTTDNTSQYIVCTPSSPMSAGTTKHMTWDFSIDMAARLYQNDTNMKFVAFLEDDGGGDYFVANAAILKQDLDSLQAPPPTLSLIDNFSDSILNPTVQKHIQFNATNLPNGVAGYYSLDNGSTWRFISNSQSIFNFINWTVPDSATTQGKIKVVAVGDTSLFSIESGTFTIANPASIHFDQPQDGIRVTADSALSFTWSKYKVGKVTLQYSIANSSSTYTSYTPIVSHTTDTFFNNWTVPDTNTRGISFQLVPDSAGVTTASIIDTIVRYTAPNNAVTPQNIPSLAITNIYPNPAANGAEMVIEYSEPYSKPVTVQVIDILGHTLPDEYSANGEAVRLKTSGLAEGTYIVRLSDGTNTVSKQVVIQ